MSGPAETTQDGRGWLMVAVTFVTLVVIYGVWYSYSVFLVALVQHFGWSRSLVAGAFSLLVLVHGGLGPLIGWMARRYGPRRLFLAGGIVMGIGLALTAETRAWWHLYLAFAGLTAVGISLAGWVPAVILVQGWFPRRFGTAMGVASAGIGVGILGMIPLAQIVIERWGWQWAFRMEAALTVGWLLPAAVWLIRDPPGFGTPESSPAGTRTAPILDAHWTLATAARTWRFWGVAAGYFTGNFATQMLMIHQVAYLVDHGVSPMTAATVGGAVGLVSIGAKVGWGIFSDRAGRELTCTLAFGCVAASIAVLVLAGQHPASALPYVYAVVDRVRVRRAVAGLSRHRARPVPGAGLFHHLRHALRRDLPGARRRRLVGRKDLRCHRKLCRGALDRARHDRPHARPPLARRSPPPESGPPAR